MAGVVEVLGVVAAVSQLTKYGFEIVNEISEFSKEIREAPHRISRLNSLVQDFISLTKSIKAQPCYQDAFTNPIIATCTLEAEALQKVLHKLSIAINGGKMAKMKGVVLFNRKEKEIARLLDSIERRKSTMHICLLS